MQGGDGRVGVWKRIKLDTNTERTSGKSGSVEKIGFGLAQKDRKKEKSRKREVRKNRGKEKRMMGVGT